MLHFLSGWVNLLGIKLNRLWLSDFLFSYETTSTTMQFCLYELSLNKEIQEKARRDVAAALKKHGGLTYEAVNDMKYLEQCIEGRQKFKTFAQKKFKFKHFRKPSKVASSSWRSPHLRQRLFDTKHQHNDRERNSGFDSHLCDTSRQGHLRESRRVYSRAIQPRRESETTSACVHTVR